MKIPSTLKHKSVIIADNYENIDELSGVVAVHRSGNEIVAYCGDKLENNVLVNVIAQIGYGAKIVDAKGYY